MRSLLYVLSALAVIGLAYWAYYENYRTQDALTRADALQFQIARGREEQRVLTAEWAYLNRPDRLRALADLNFKRLQLMPFQPYQFGRIDQVEYPPRKWLTITNSTEVSSGEPAE